LTEPHTIHSHGGEPHHDDGHHGDGPYGDVHHRDAHTRSHGFVDRIHFAVNGFYVAFRREKSLKIQSAAALAVLIVLAATRAPALWWALAALTSGLVIAAELANTALEILADRVHPTIHPEIRAAKDVAAGAVLVAAIAAVLVALAFVLR
jgi:diacylglycerol kinase (ATP)